MCCCSKFFVSCHQIIHCTGDLAPFIDLPRISTYHGVSTRIESVGTFVFIFPTYSLNYSLTCTKVCHKMEKTIWLHVLWQRTTIFLWQRTTSSSSINQQKATMFYSRLLPHITSLYTCNEIIPHKTFSRQSRIFYLESMLFYTGHWV